MGIEPAVGRLLLRCLWAAISAALVTGCMTSRVEESKNAATGLAPGESV